jgi:hypothetical protein
MKNKKTIYIEDIFKKAENRLKNIVYSKNFKKWFFYSFFIALIIIIVIFYNAFKSSEEAEATWWDDTWSYRRAITVTNNTTEESEVYINLSIDSSDTTKFQADCGDLRFTDINGNIIPYYIVSGCGTVSTSINVYYDTLKAGASTLYYYYGNSSADNGFSSTNFSTQALNYLVGSPSTEEKSKAPVGYWSFDEGYGTTAYDGSGKGNDGTITGATWASEDQCVVGKCLYFRGTTDYRDRVAYGNIYNEDDIQQEMTVGIWFKTDTLEQYISAGAYTGVLISKSQYSVDNSAWGLYVSPSGAQWKVYNDSNLGYSQFADVEINEWNYVVGTWDNGEQKFYLNGVLIDADTRSFTKINDSSSIVFVGLEDNTVNKWFKGYVDEPKIYPYARTADEIKQDYNAGLVGMGTSKGAGVAIGGSSDKWMTDGLVGHWKMDEASWNGTAGEVIDSSGNGNNGTSAGGATTGAGKFGSGGSFDGVDDYVNAGDDSSLNPGHITVSAWIKKPSGTTGTVLRKGSSYLLDFWSIGNSLRFTINSKWSLGAGVVYPDDGNWHFLLGTYDGQNINVFIDGELKKTDAHVDSIFVTSNSLSIGKNSVASDNYFNGQIDEARIYNRALSADEVKKLYEYAPGPVGHWKMDEKSGTTAYDISGNNLTGNLINTESTDWIQGKFGSALNLDGSNEYVVVSDNDILDSGTIDNTVTMWVYLNSLKNYNGLISKGDSRVAGCFTYTINSSGNIQYDKGICAAALSLANPITTGTWHHIAIVKDVDVGMVVYVDGKYGGKEAQCQANDTYSDDDLKIGYSANTYTGYLDGKIDDVRIYNYARTQKQILEDMNAGRPAQNKPVAYWKFDEGYGTTVYDSVGNNNGTINGASWTNDGRFGKALSFDGSDDYVGLSDYVDMGMRDFSLCAWVKTTSSVSYGQWIVGQLGTAGGTTDEGYSLIMEGGYPGVKLSSTGENLYTLQSPNLHNDGNWHHVMATVKRGGSIRVYVDGLLENEGTDVISGSIDHNYSLLIGARPGGGTEWDGQIDEVKIYNYALSENEVKKDYNQGKALVMGAPKTVSGATGQSAEYCVPGDTSTCNPPVAEWKFDDKSGTTVYDTSGNGNNGTMSNMEDSDWKTSDQCKKGRCLEFDGVDEYISANNDSSLQIDSGSLSAWIKTSNAGNSYRGIAGNLNAYTMYLAGNVFGVYDDSSDVFRSTGINLADDEWHNVYMTFSSGVSDGTKLYIDGELVLTTIITNNVFSGFKIAMGQGGSTQHFKGKIDDIKVYNYIRTPAQVAWDYNRGKPIGHWKMDEGEGMTVYDHSGNGNHGTMTNMSQSAWVDGKVNGGLEFDGVDDYVEVGNNDIFNVTEGITISVRVKFDSVGSNSIGIIGKAKTGVSPQQGYVLGTLGTGTKIRFYPIGPQLSYVEESSNIITDTWIHYVGTYDKSNIKIYRNGVLSNSEPSTDEIITSDQPIVFGRWYGNYSGYYLNGSIDDVQIYDYALTAEQIKEVYNGGAVRFR